LNSDQIQFKKELAKIAAEIEKIIKNDNFPVSIKPAFLKNAVLDYPLREGKRLRPALLIWTCGMLGGKIKKAILPAAAVEIFHNWTLVHDDIIDNDNIRKNAPSSHKILANFAKGKYLIADEPAEKFGKDIAILAGDIQHAWAIDILSRANLKEKTKIHLIHHLCSLGGRDLICGECLDVEITYRNWTELKYRELISIASLKTAKLIEYCVFAATKIAAENKKISSEQIRNIMNFAKFAGIAFQIQDDFIGIFQDGTGKQTLADFSEAKPTSIILQTLKNVKEKERNFLFSLKGKKKFSKNEIKQVRKIVIDSGAANICLGEAEKMKTKALKLLLNFPESRFRRLISEWTNFILNRKK